MGSPMRGPTLLKLPSEPPIPLLLLAALPEEKSDPPPPMVNHYFFHPLEIDDSYPPEGLATLFLFLAHPVGHQIGPPP